MTLTVTGDTRVEVESDADRFPTEALLATFCCASGDPTLGEWTSVPDEMSHLCVCGADGFTACLPVTDILGRVSVFERRLLDNETLVSNAGLLRFVAPGVSDTRTVKPVVEIEPVHLESCEDAETFKNVPLEA